jgi:hypothetical protein
LSGELAPIDYSNIHVALAHIDGAHLLVGDPRGDGLRRRASKIGVDLADGNIACRAMVAGGPAVRD